MHELQASVSKLKESISDATPAIEKASILRTVALLETLQGLVESAALQVLFVQTWELGGSSFIASWSVGHYLKRPQGVKEKAQTDGPPPTPSEARTRQTRETAVSTALKKSLRQAPQIEASRPDATAEAK
ncbi:unnamed protein product [Durusdinium trenchii]|uniref:Uncharacterized protein n=1 Tax=Durusdinium trenchii TaxID=1381693 RepID=A0ABP0RXQ8_9DINO